MGVEGGLLVEFAEREAGELFGLRLGGAGISDASAAVEDAGGENQGTYKLPKILSKCLKKGSSDGAGEGDAGEAV